MEHIIFGSGVITEVKDNKIWVQFQAEIGTKEFLYPEAFEKFLKAVSPILEDNILEERLSKQERIELDYKEKERALAELEEKKAKLEPTKKKSIAKSKKKKFENKSMVCNNGSRERNVDNK